MARLSVLIKAIEDAYRILEEFGKDTNGDIQDSFKEALQQSISKKLTPTLIISVQQLFQAKLLLEYFYKHQLILLGANFNPTHTLIEIINNLISFH